jgi:flagellar hook-associated protein 2
MAISSPGLGSGLDVNGIITKLMQVEQQPLTQLNSKEASYQSKISALGTLQGAVSSLDTALSSLVPSSSSTLTTSVSVANSAIALATATSSATVGSYSLEVSQLAKAHKIVSVAKEHKITSSTYASASSSISTGTLSLQVGSGAAKSITITSANATLTGLKNAINAAAAGVTADIIPDGSSVRLAISSNTIGAAGKITASGLTGFDFDPTTTTGSMSQDSANGGQAAQGFNSATDSIETGTYSISVGTGTTKNISITSSNNTLAGLKDAINNSGVGVTASLETVSSSDIRLILTGSATGSANTITASGLTGLDFNGSTGSGSMSQSVADGGQAAQNAVLKVNGTSITSSSNTVTSAISGVTLNLAQTTSVATTLKVSQSQGSTFAEQASNKFRTYRATLADSTIATAAASASATSGSYSLEVSQLATTHRITTPPTQAHQITSAPPKAQILRSGVYATSTDLTDGISDSTLSISVGGATAQSVTVAAGSTIDDLKTAINDANVGVTASLVADGSGYRLQLTSNTAGAGGKITLTGLTGFDYNSSTATGSLSLSQAAAGYSSSADAIATGTMSISINGGTATSVSIDSSNNTLSGLKTAINAAHAGVTASIISDDVGVRLVLKSDTPGIQGAITTSGLSGFEFNSTTTSLSEDAADGGQSAQGYTSATQSIATGTLKLTIGSGIAHDIKIDSTNNTLTGLKDAINDANIGVSASLVSVSSGDVRLVLTSGTTGAAGKLSLSGLAGFTFDADSATGNLSQSAADGGEPALSSIIKLNGVTITNDSNTVTDALQGVTLNLAKTTTAATTLVVSQDKTSSLSATLTSLVKAYNDLNKSVVDLGKYDEKTKQGGPLVGNSTLRNVSFSIRSSFQAMPTGLSSNYVKRLSDIGLEMQKDGTITFNAAKLTTATGNDYDGVALLAATFGKATKSLTAGMLGTKGSLTAATDGLNASVKTLADRRTELQTRLVSIEARYRRQFSSLDSLMSSLNSTSNYLTQQLSSLSKSSN